MRRNANPYLTLGNAHGAPVSRSVPGARTGAATLDTAQALASCFRARDGGQRPRFTDGYESLERGFL